MEKRHQCLTPFIHVAQKKPLKLFEFNAVVHIFVGLLQLRQLVQCTTIFHKTGSQKSYTAFYF